MLHANTRTSIVHEFLLLEMGDRCDEDRRQESERILRAQPYLADARILVVEDGADRVILDVFTVDEVSSVAALNVAAGGAPFFRRARLGSYNVLGHGVYFAGEWQAGGGYRDGYGARLRTTQIMGEPLELTLDGMRSPLGGDWLVGLSRPFLTEYQRLAWESFMGMDAEYLSFHREDALPIALRTDRRFASLGFVTRLGAAQPGALALVGASLSYERDETASRPVFVMDTGLVMTSDPVLDGRYGKRRTARTNLLIGFRDISFLRVTGFEALEGSQDMWRGVQVGALVGKGIRRLFGTDSEDLFVSMDSYAGFGTARSFLAARAEIEGRRVQETGKWDRGLATSTVTWYRRLWHSHTLVTRAVASVGWRPVVPFQLVLDDTEAGVIGFRGSRSAGARRVVGRLEDRWYLGRPTGSAAVGAALFVEAGKLWAGSAPYGITTPTAASAGIGILAAVPPRSQRMWRLDIASRLTPDPHAGRFEIRLSSNDGTRELRAEPPDVTRSRMRSVPRNLLIWPEGREQ
jgi:hypothetical protein